MRGSRGAALLAAWAICGCGGDDGAGDAAPRLDGGPTVPDSGGCASCTSPLDCDDGVFCNGAELCASGCCVAAVEPVDCDDADACTLDECSEPDRECQHLAPDAD